MDDISLYVDIYMNTHCMGFRESKHINSRINGIIFSELNTVVIWKT